MPIITPNAVEMKVNGTARNPQKILRRKRRNGNGGSDYENYLKSYGIWDYR